MMIMISFLRKRETMQRRLKISLHYPINLLLHRKNHPPSNKLRLIPYNQFKKKLKRLKKRSKIALKLSRMLRQKLKLKRKNQKN